MHTGVFTGDKAVWGVALTIHHLPSAEVKDRPLFHLWAFVACSRVTFTFIYLLYKIVKA
jgi:hypothetical protein